MPVLSNPTNVKAVAVSPTSAVVSFTGVPEATSYLVRGLRWKSYSLSSITYVPQTNTGTLVTLTDDSVSSVLSIGFSFNFDGSNYTQFYIGSNGWISFFAGNSTTDYTSAKKSSVGIFMDLDPSRSGSQVRYQTTGTSPNRVLVVSWISVPEYNIYTTSATFHILLYETTNIIEIHISNKPGNVNATHGVGDADGTLLAYVSGRNNTKWTATNDAYMWTPVSSPTELYSITPTSSSTPSYNLSSITYVPRTNTGTVVSLIDDSVSSLQSIGFTFNFNGTNYTLFYIGSNGWISFVSGNSTTPYTSAKKSSVGIFADWNPSPQNFKPEVRYQTTGTSPNRVLVVSWTSVPEFNLSTSATFHIVLYETTNIIEIHIGNKPGNLPATQGLGDANGTLFSVVSGRNNSIWTGTNDAYRWTPIYSLYTLTGLLASSYYFEVAARNGIINATSDYSRSDFITISGTKTTTTITVLPTATLQYGGSANSATLTGGSGSVAGTFSIIDTTIPSSVGIYTTTVLFTPTDSTNYFSATSNITITVGNKASTTITVLPTATLQ